MDMRGRVGKARVMALLWHGVALMLLVWTVVFVRRARAAHEAQVWLGIGAGALVGLLKGRLLLQRSARRNLARIGALPEEASLLRSFHPTLLLLVPFMMGLGIALRHLAEAGTLHWGLVAAIYAGVVAALNVGAVPYWTYRAPSDGAALTK